VIGIRINNTIDVVPSASALAHREDLLNNYFRSQGAEVLMWLRLAATPGRVLP
jgi:hypothetical protein